MSKDASTTDPNRFKSRAAAAAWLKEQKAPISQRGFYDACDRGFPAVAADKSLSRFEVSEYLRSLESKQRRAPGGSGTIREDAETRKAVADAAKAEIQAEQMKRQLDKDWISRADADLETCAWAGLTRDYIAHRLSQSLPTLIHTAGGDMTRAPDVQAVIDQAITDGCNDVANSGEITVDIEDTETD